MTGVSVGTGLVSGIDFASLVDSLIAVQRAPIVRMEARQKDLVTKQTALTQLQAQLLSLSVSVRTLNDQNTFRTQSLSVSDPTQFTAVSRLTATSGTHQFQSVRLASTHSLLSKGFADANTVNLGIGKVVISEGGFVDQSLSLELLNGGQGVRRGVIRITDRTGASAEVDLRNAATVQDVVQTINSAEIGVQVNSSADGFLLQDLTEGSGSLTVTEVGGGSAARDLGLIGSTSENTLTGTSVLQLTSSFKLSQLNDGNGIKSNVAAGELSVSLQDGSTLTLQLDGATTLGDIVTKIESTSGNAGKLTATIVNNRLQLTDTTTGSGTFAVNAVAGSNAARVLGFEGSSAVGNLITGERLIGGLSSPLLRNLKGGQGVETGQMTLTDRTGATATLDLSAAETLGEVISAINGARTSGGVKLQISAQVDANGTGLTITENSGATTSNFQISDVSGTLAADLGIAVDGTTTEVSSGRLNLQFVNEATSLSTYAPKGGAVSRGAFQITDSAGGVAVISLTSAEQTIGDVIKLINNTSGADVTAQLNETGDGFVLMDQAGGAETLKIQDLGGGKAATDLRLTGAAVTGGDGKQQIGSRQVAIVDVSSTDTLISLSTKINSAGGAVRSSVVDTGAAINSFRLNLISTQSGSAGRLSVTTEGLDLGLATQSSAQDAVLRVGANSASGYLRTSSTNEFRDAVTGIDLTLLSPGSQTAMVTAELNRTKISDSIQSFVTSYNAYIDLTKELTKFDTETLQRGPLGGSASLLRVNSRFNSLISARRLGTDDTIRQLTDLGISVASTGKISLDTTKLNEAITANASAVSSVFTNATTGFAAQFQTTLDAYNDPYEGSLTLEGETLQKNIDSMDQRIAQLELLLEGSKERMTRQFVNMETILSGLQSQQASLGALDNIVSNLKAASSK